MMMHIMFNFFAAVGLIVTLFLIAVFIIATVKVFRAEKIMRRNLKGAETLGCGEHVFAVLTNKNGIKETLQ